MKNNVLIVAAHSDDETLGCGGSIARHAYQGDIVHVVFMADGVTSRNPNSQVELDRRISAASLACEILGIMGIRYLGLPDNRMDSLALLDVVQPLEKIIQEFAPNIVYTHHRGDLNIDHRITHQAVMTACRPQPDGTVKEIFGFEILSSTEWSFSRQEMFVPNMFCDISSFLSTKLKALQIYEMEMRPAPHTRSIIHAEYLARHRGNTVGVEAAEAFEVIRIIR